MDPASTPISLDAPRDAAAFERLYRASVLQVHTLASRLLGAQDADDATQEVFVRAWHKRETYRGEGDVRGWLHRLALHALLNRRRGRARRAEALQQHAPDGSGFHADVDELPMSPRGDVDAHMDLQAALERLPPGARQVFVLHDVQGLQHGEIAELLGCNVGTSKSQLHRARALLRRALGGATAKEHRHG